MATRVLAQGNLQARGEARVATTVPPILASNENNGCHGVNAKHSATKRVLSRFGETEMSVVGGLFLTRQLLLEDESQARNLQHR